MRETRLLNLCVSTMFVLAMVGAGMVSDQLRLVSYSYIIFYILLVFMARIHQPSKLKIDTLIGITFLYLVLVLLSVSDVTGIRFLMFNFVFVGLFLLGAQETAKLAPSLPPKATFIIALSLVALHLVSGGGVFENSNYAAALFVIMSLPLLSSVPKSRLLYVWLFVLAVTIILNSRSVILSFVLASLFAGAFFSKQSIWKRMLLRLLLTSCIIATIALVVGYYNSPILMDQFFLELSGKRLESGRVEIWSSVIFELDAVELFLGTGTGGTYQTENGEVLSVHSSYVFLISRIGILGLTVFLLAMVVRLRELVHHGYTWSFIASFFLLLRDFFETSLVANNVPIAAFFWLFALTGQLDRSPLAHHSAKSRKNHETNPPEPLHRPV